MKRRALLSSAVAALVGGAGCLGRDDPQPRVSWVGVNNDTDRAYDAAVTILDGEEMVFDERFRLGTGQESSVRFFDRPVTGEGDYVIRATVGEMEQELDASDHVDGDESCIGVRFLVADGGSLVIDLVKATEQC
jgi:hypothetical protein